MPNSYTIEGDGVTIKVGGRLNSSGSVTVKKNGMVYQFDESQGQTDFGAVSATLSRDDGGYIDEGAVSQEIHLPDGTEIEKLAVTQKARLPDGRVIQGKSSDITSFTINSGNKSSSVNMSLSMSSDSDEYRNSSVEGNNSEEDEILKQARSNLISGITPGFWTMLFFAYGLVFASQSAIYIALFMYIFFAVPAIFQYVGSLLTTSNISIPELSAKKEEEDGSSSYPDEQKQKFLEGEISEKEFEERIEEYFQGRAQDNDHPSTDKNVELETV
jgi:uncharacterized membrane protein